MDTETDRDGPKRTFLDTETDFLGTETDRNGPKRTFLDTETDFLGTETDFLGTETDLKTKKKIFLKKSFSTSIFEVLSNLPRLSLS